jgi:SAM-dependent methyltransferase
VKIANRCICCGDFDLESHPAILSPFIAERTMGWEPCTLTESSGLREVPLGIHYPVCQTKKCNVCGTIFSDIRFSSKEMINLYNGYQNFSYNNRRCYYEKEYKERVKKIEKSNSREYVEGIEKFIGKLESPRIFDWGGDTGANTPFRESAAYVHIYDLSNNAPAPKCELVHKITLAAYHYDLIVCSNVLEHVSKPKKIIESIAPCVDPDTLFYIEVPFENIPFEKKNLWHEHINMFTKEGLEIMVERIGLTIIRSEIQEAPWEGAMKPFIRILCTKGE